MASSGPSAEVIAATAELDSVVRDAEVFRSLVEDGYTASDDGTGFGLGIVNEVARAHGWTGTATAGDDGARFGVETR